MQEGTIMTARHKAIARRRRPQSLPEPGWPGVVLYALRDWGFTLRLCAILAVAGGVLLLAVMLGLRFWL